MKKRSRVSERKIEREIVHAKWKRYMIRIPQVSWWESSKYWIHLITNHTSLFFSLSLLHLIRINHCNELLLKICYLAMNIEA